MKAPNVPIKKMKGGAEMTFCQCGYGSTGCYGSVECDCTDPRFPRCIDEGTSSSTKLNKIRELRK